MRLALGAIGSALSQLNSRWGTLIAANVVAFVLSLPLLAAAATGGLATRSLLFATVASALALGVLPNPLAAGVHFLAHELAERDTIFLSDQWDGLRRFGWLALRAWLISAVGTALILANLGFYTVYAIPLALLWRLVWFYVLLVWLAMHVYVYPLIMAQEVKRLWLIYRNAFVMASSHQSFTLVALAAWLAVLLLSAVSGLIALFGLAAAALIQHNAAAALLGMFEREE